MPDVFISYSAKDEGLAQFVREHLVRKELDVFLASISLKTGEHCLIPPQVTAKSHLD